MHAFTDGRDTSPTRRREVPRRGPGLDGGGRRGPDRQRHRPLLRDGPRQALGPRAEGLRPARARSAASTTPTRARRPRRRRTTATRPTSSSPPTTVGEEAKIRPGDAVIAFNFRPDRMREITLALCDPDVRRDRPRRRRRDRAVRDAGRVRRGLGLSGRLPAASGPALTIGEVIAREGKGQLHVAETEKYPHVTYFFNGGEETPYEGEVRELVPSPRDVPTYDFKPEMSAREATDAFVKHFAGREAGVRDHQLRQPGHGRPHGRDPGRGEGGRDRRRVPRPRRRGRPRGRRRLSSSPPTTATATTCSTTTARPTPRTR